MKMMEVEEIAKLTVLLRKRSTFQEWLESPCGSITKKGRGNGGGLSVEQLIGLPCC